MSAQASKAARELAHDLGLHHWDQGNDGFGGEWELNKGAAEKIQSALSDLLEKAAIVHNWTGDDTLKCHEAHDALGKALEPWETGE